MTVLCLSGCTPEQQAAYLAHVQEITERSRTDRAPSDEVLERLRECESHGDYSVVSASGTYRGAYQFSRRTWNNVARSFLPSYVGYDPAAAPPFVQDAMARALWSSTGPRSWPVCGYRAS